MKTTGMITGIIAVLVCFSCTGVTSVSSQIPGLVGLLTKDLGVTEKQAQGGAGAIFNMARENLGAEDFGKVANAVPEMDNLLKAAPKTGGLGSAIGGKTSLLGGSASKLAGLASLAGSFSQLGMKSDMASKFVPIILSYVQSTGGDSVKSLLAGVLK